MADESRWRPWDDHLRATHNHPNPTSRQRRHLAIGMHAPIECETIRHTQPAAQLSQVS